MTDTPEGVILSRSLSARRAWIETVPANTNMCRVPVALRKEGVD